MAAKRDHGLVRQLIADVALEGGVALLWCLGRLRRCGLVTFYRSPKPRARHCLHVAVVPCGRPATDWRVAHLTAWQGSVAHVARHGVIGSFESQAAGMLAQCRNCQTERASAQHLGTVT